MSWNDPAAFLTSIILLRTTGNRPSGKHQTHLGSVTHIYYIRETEACRVCVIDKKAMGEDISYLNIKRIRTSQSLSQRYC